MTGAGPEVVYAVVELRYFPTARLVEVPEVAEAAERVRMLAQEGMMTLMNYWQVRLNHRFTKYTSGKCYTNETEIMSSKPCVKS